MRAATTSQAWTARVPARLCAAAIVFGSFTTQSARADEIRLKDGKKLYGVIVAYEDNMFKVKTDFGYVLVEKDKIASIVPSTPAETESKKDATTKKDSSSKPSPSAPSVETTAASGTDASPEMKEASAKAAVASGTANPEKVGPKVGNSPVRPSLPVNNAVSPASTASPPPLKSAAPATTTGLAAPPPAPAEPKEEAPANREEVQGNLYTNFTYGFRMYKAPSWNLLEDARSALPNAIVALGTTDESTLMVVGREKSKENLDATAKSVENRLREVYEDYRQLSQRKTTVSGQPAQEFRYRGKADGHDWSGTLVVIARGTDIFTVLGMTSADTDLIQIQENVIARSIASLNFTAK
jgi:hypothetical protein